VVRVRDDRVFFARPAPAAAGRRGGRPRRHGARICCAEPDTWPTPDVTHTSDEPAYGRIDVQAWHGLHPRQHTYRDPNGAMTIVEGTLIRLRVSRLPGRRDRQPKTLWLWWHGDDPHALDLDRVWRAYVRRFDVEHTFRFAKQVLGWTVPKIRTPEQADRWTWLILAALSQLRMAPPAGRRPPAALATAPARDRDDPGPGPTGFWPSAAPHRHPGQLAETHPARHRPSQRIKIRARAATPSRQESPRQDPEIATTTLNPKLRSYVLSVNLSATPTSIRLAPTLLDVRCAGRLHVRRCRHPLGGTA
jgi:hypothetical protein